MSIRIEIELTSSAPDGSWTWRAAGAREPRGVLDGSILPGGSAVGDQLRVETEHDVDGIRVLSVVPPKEKAAKSDRLELLPTDEPFEPVVQQRVPGRRDDGDRRRRRDRPEGGPDRRREGGERRDGRGRDGDRRSADRRPGADRTERADRGERRSPSDDRRRHRPHFTPPPEVPQRPKPKRLKPGHQHVTGVLASLPEEQRPVAELAQQGIGAVRQRLREENVRLSAQGKPTMPEAAVLKMAEELIPRLRVADWLDRAEAAQRQLDHLDLRDLRSVVAAADDPVVARDESTRELAVALKQALVTKQDEELALWLADVEAALDVGRVVRALRLSSVPPKAGVPFPGALATRLAEAATASLQPTDGPDRWAAVLEAAAFSPVRTHVAPTAPPEQRTDELLATVRRLGPLLPQVAVVFGVEVPAGAPVPKPLRPAPRRQEAKKQAGKPARPPREGGGRDRGASSAAPAPAGPAPGERPDEASGADVATEGLPGDTAPAEPVATTDAPPDDHAADAAEPAGDPQHAPAPAEAAAGEGTAEVSGADVTSGEMPGDTAPAEPVPTTAVQPGDHAADVAEPAGDPRDGLAEAADGAGAVSETVAREGGSVQPPLAGDAPAEPAAAHAPAGPAADDAPAQPAVASDDAGSAQDAPPRAEPGDAASGEPPPGDTAPAEPPHGGATGESGQVDTAPTAGPTEPTADAASTDATGDSRPVDPPPS